MRKAVLLWVGAVLLAAAVSGAPQRTLIGTSLDHSLEQAGNCEDFAASMLTSLPARVKGEETRDVSLSGIDLVKVRASQEGGVSIRGWDKPTARLVVCKFAASRTQAEARKVLDEITVTYLRGNIGTFGPLLDQTHVWWVNIILYVPKRATLDVAATNGGIAIRNMNGKVTAQSTNGGISVAQCAGEHKVTTENGGISLEKITGRVEATTQHGMIALKVRDSHVPGIEARAGDEGEIMCKLDQCSDGLWTADRKVLRLGAAAPSIRLSTISAPIMIENVR